MAALMLKELRETVAVMRELGVRTLSVNGMRIDLDPIPAPHVPIPDEVTAGEATCNCSHSEHEHDPDGRCIMGCTAEQCLTKKP